jgi:hypothetical protein
MFFEQNSARQTTSGNVKSEANRCFQSGKTKQSFSAEILNSNIFLSTNHPLWSISVPANSDDTSSSSSFSL